LHDFILDEKEEEETMKFLRSIGGLLAGLFNAKGKEQRRSRRDPTYIEVMYVTRMREIISGHAKVMNVNKGGLCLDLDRVIEPNSSLAVTINPHTVIKYINFKKVMKDERGRCLFKVLWVKKKEDEEAQGQGCFAGGFFIPSDSLKSEEA
jgi:hypothetical protein